MPDNNTSYRNLLKAMSLFSGVQGLNILLNIGRAKLAAMLLGPAGIGLNAIYNETRELIHTSTNLGMDTSGVREISRAFGEQDREEDKERLRDAVMLTRSWVMLFALAGVLVTFLLAEPLSWMTFSDGSHAGGYRMLSLAVGFSTLTCGELVVLRGLQRLKALATVSVMHVVAGILTTIPVYYLWGIDGVAAALVLMTGSMAAVTMSFSYRIERPRFCFRKEHLAKGRTMLVIGFSFVLAGFVSSGSKLAVKAFINHYGSLYAVGLFNAGFTIAMTCIGVVFSSLDKDYFPRLSSIFSDTEQRRTTVRQQTDMALTLVFPTVVCAIFAMPLMVPILFSSEFEAVVPMAQAASLGTLFGALYLPAAYMPLAAGNSKVYLLLQAFTYLCFTPAIMIGYTLGGITGAGIGLMASNAMEVAIDLSIAKWRYGVTIGRRIAVKAAGATVYASSCYLLAQCLHGTAYIAAGTVLSLASVAMAGKTIMAKMKDHRD